MRALSLFMAPIFCLLTGLGAAAFLSLLRIAAGRRPVR